MKVCCKVWVSGGIAARCAWRGCCLLLLAWAAGGCSTGPTQGPCGREAINTLPPQAARRARSPAPQPSVVPKASSTGVLPPASRQRMPSAREEVAARLASSFAVAVAQPDTLLIRRADRAPFPPTALFEEAILLGQIRGILDAATLKTAASTATFHKGSAAMGFPPAVNPGKICVVIAKILALDGINEVWARFSP